MTSPGQLNLTPRIAEAGIDGEGHVVIDFDPHVGECGSDISRADPAASVHVLRLEWQVEFMGYFQGKEAIIRSRINER